MRVATFLLISLLFLSLHSKTAHLSQKIGAATTQALQDGIFSAASISVWKDGKQILSISKGVVNFKTPHTKVTSKTLFDLASLTKPIVVGSLFFFFENHAQLKKEWQVSRFFPSIKRDVTLFQLLTHTSSLPPYAKFFTFPRDKKIAKRKERVIKYVADFTGKYPGVYSDINYMLLGIILEKIGGKRLDKLFADFVHNELSFKSSLSFTPRVYKISPSRIAATYNSPIRKKMCQGEVEDENAAYLGGVSGHAGLFGTADDVSHFFSLLLTKSHYRNAIVKQIGFDTKEGEDSNYSSLADTSCSGHLGWSGTAFLICPKQNIVITILTNRTHSEKFATTDLEQIKKFRQQIFTLIFESVK